MLRNLTIAALALMGAACPAAASPIRNREPASFSTSWTIDGSGITGPGALSIAGVTGGRLYDEASSVGGFPNLTAGPGGMYSFLWGELRVADLPPGTVSRYNDAPFTFRLAVEGNDPIDLNGVLNGVIGEPGNSDFTIKFDTSKLMEIDALFAPDTNPKGRGLILLTGGLPSILDVPHGILKYDLTTIDRGNVHITAVLYPVPEPASLAVFAVVATGIGWMNRRRARARLGWH